MFWSPDINVLNGVMPGQRHHHNRFNGVYGTEEGILERDCCCYSSVVRGALEIAEYGVVNGHSMERCHCYLLK